MCLLCACGLGQGLSLCFLIWSWEDPNKWKVSTRREAVHLGMVGSWGCIPLVSRQEEASVIQLSSIQLSSYPAPEMGLQSLPSVSGEGQAGSWCWWILRERCGGLWLLCAAAVLQFFDSEHICWWISSIAAVSPPVLFAFIDCQSLGHPGPEHWGGRAICWIISIPQLRNTGHQQAKLLVWAGWFDAEQDSRS